MLEAYYSTGQGTRYVENDHQRTSVRCARIYNYNYILHHISQEMRSIHQGSFKKFASLTGTNHVIDTAFTRVTLSEAKYPRVYYKRSILNRVPIGTCFSNVLRTSNRLSSQVSRPIYPTIWIIAMHAFSRDGFALVISVLPSVKNNTFWRSYIHCEWCSHCIYSRPWSLDTIFIYNVKRSLLEASDLALTEKPSTRIFFAATRNVLRSFNSCMVPTYVPTLRTVQLWKSLR